jgi:hypothetical protein
VERREIGAKVHGAHSRDQPKADVIYCGIHILELVNIRRLTGGTDDLHKGWGVRIYWGIMGEPTEKDRFRFFTPPRSGYDLPHSTFIHQKKYCFDFDGDSGKTVWFCLRYENKKGGRDGDGPFGPLFSAIIP